MENFRDDNIPLVIISRRFLVFAVSGKIIIKLTCINEDHDIADRPRRFDEANKNGLDIFRMDVI